MNYKICAWKYGLLQNKKSPKPMVLGILVTKNYNIGVSFIKL